MINKIIDETGIKIDIEQTGEVFVVGVEQEMINKAISMIEDIVAEAEPGKIYKGTVTRIESFGAFIEILPGKQGLLHISQISNKRVEKVEDVLSIGDVVDVLVTEIDNKDRINLSIKAIKK